MSHIIREVTEIELHPKIMNMEDGFCLSKSWKPLICSTNDRRKPLSHDKRSGFSARPCRSMDAALIRAQNMLSLGTHQPIP
jgi:hypothetical protein